MKTLTHSFLALCFAVGLASAVARADDSPTTSTTGAQGTQGTTMAGTTNSDMGTNSGMATPTTKHHKKHHKMTSTNDGSAMSTTNSSSGM